MALQWTTAWTGSSVSSLSGAAELVKTELASNTSAAHVELMLEAPKLSQSNPATLLIITSHF